MEINTPQVSEVKEAKKTNWLLIILLVLFFSLLSIGGTYYFLMVYEEKDVTLDEEVVIEKEEDVLDYEGSDRRTYSKYLGEYIKAEIPHGWTIVEYKDGDGSEMLVENVEYQGLTGMRILNDLGTEIFSLERTDGLGGFSFCIPEVQFPDTPKMYIDGLISKAEDFEREQAEMDNRDYKPTDHIIPKIERGEFTEFNFFEYRGRRVGSDLYWNDLENLNSNEFHTSCPFPMADMHVLSFEFQDDTSLDFKLKISETANEKMLLFLDDILDTMEWL